MKYFILLVFLIISDALYAQKWKPLGPFINPTFNEKDFSSRHGNGIGRVSFVRYRSINMKSPMEIYLGTPYGGLWKSIDQGKSWKPWNTDHILIQGVADIAFHPDGKTFFLVTGDPDCGLNKFDPALGSEACASYGIIKSKNKGKTWGETPIGNWFGTDGKQIVDFWKYPSLKVIRKLLINPSSPQHMLCVLHTYNDKSDRFDGYIYQSEDGGENWKISLYEAGSWLKDLEFAPSRSGVIYAGGKTVFRSMDGGKSWRSLQSHGLPPDSEVARCEIATCPTLPSSIFILAVNKKSKQNEVYRSDDWGESFTKIISSSASPEWRTALAVDPTNGRRIYMTSANKISTFISDDGIGYRFVSNASTIHDDVHDITIDSTGTIYGSTDGGLYVSTDQSKSWKSLNNNLNIAECWSVAVSQNGPLRILSGLQDCGTILYSADSTKKYHWKTTRGGDGMKTAFDADDFNRCYSNDGNNNLLVRSENGGHTWSSNLGITGVPSAYLRPFVINPLNSSSLLTGYHHLYRSYDDGTSWTTISDVNIPNKEDMIIAIGISPADTNVIYFAYQNPAWNTHPEFKLFRSTNGGIDWIDISEGLAGVTYWKISSICVDAFDAQKVYVGFKGASKIKVMFSDQGGRRDSWKNADAGLPVDADINAMILDKQTGFLYAATHKGVWQKKGESKWERLGKNLPDVMVCDLDIRYVSHELVAGTHGRGVWKLKLK